MADKSRIDYTPHSWGPWRGCTKVSAGCANCFAEHDMKRYGHNPTIVVRAADKTFRRPLARRRDGAWAWPNGERVFVCPWSDFFHADADQWRAEAWSIIRQRPGLIFVILTKRPERIGACLPDDWGDGWSNVWLLVSAEDQETADLRVPQLLNVPAVVRGVSCEPLLDAVDLRSWLGLCQPCPKCRCWENQDGYDVLGAKPGYVFCNSCGKQVPAAWREGLQWVPAGCESAPGGKLGRPADTDWFRSLRDECVAAGVPYFLKQMDVGGKLTHLPLLDGRQWSEVPEKGQA